MPIAFQRWERRDGVDRDEFALAALEACRRTRTTNPKVRSSRFYWHSASEIVILTEGEQGWNDYNPDPDPEWQKAAFVLDDLARVTQQETWGDAGAGTQTWEQAGRPSGTS